jgi:hypothetical protein
MKTFCLILSSLVLLVILDASCAKDDEPTVGGSTRHDEAAVGDSAKDDKSTAGESANRWQRKIAFDMSQIRPDGITGPPDGLVSVSYEFCIPGDDELLDRVLAIDPTIKYAREAPGRIGCDKTQYLCMGDTHNPHWKDILRQIAELDFVTRIERTYWE